MSLKNKGLSHHRVSQRKTRDDFINQSNLIHGYKYNYDLVVYVRNEDYVIIECKKHGHFLQTPKTHTTGRGCKKCSGEKRRLTTESFINRCSKIHDNFYSYSKTIYTLHQNKVLITCPTHGDFYQAARDHIAGSGCISCANSLTSWSKSQYFKMSKPYGFKSKIYLVRMSFEDEIFYKVGITVSSISERYWGVKPYSVECLSFIEMQSDKAWEEEKRIHKSLRLARYKPKFKFGGHTERFSELTKDIKDYFGVVL